MQSDQLAYCYPNLDCSFWKKFNKFFPQHNLPNNFYFDFAIFWYKNVDLLWRNSTAKEIETVSPWNHVVRLLNFTSVAVACLSSFELCQLARARDLDAFSWRFRLVMPVAVDKCSCSRPVCGARVCLYLCGCVMSRCCMRRYEHAMSGCAVEHCRMLPNSVQYCAQLKREAIVVVAYWVSERTNEWSESHRQRCMLRLGLTPIPRNSNKTNRQHVPHLRIGKGQTKTTATIHFELLFSLFTHIVNIFNTSVWMHRSTKLF